MKLISAIEALFKKNRITRYLGHGQIVRAQRIDVVAPRETLELKTKSILIATGSRPATCRVSPLMAHGS